MSKTNLQTLHEWINVLPKSNFYFEDATTNSPLSLNWQVKSRRRSPPIIFRPSSHLNWFHYFILSQSYMSRNT